MDIEIKIDAEEVMQMFDDQLDSKQRQKVIGAAKTAGGRVLRKRAYELAPVGSYPPNQIAAGRIPGRLKRSLRAKTGLKITRRHKNVYVVVGLSDEDPFYARFVEEGHGGPRPAPPKRFMEQAAIETEDAVIKAFSDKFIQSTYRQIDISNRRAARRRRR